VPSLISATAREIFRVTNVRPRLGDSWLNLEQVRPRKSEEALSASERSHPARSKTNILGEKGAENLTGYR
jgi:hypothetical protein